MDPSLYAWRSARGQGRLGVEATVLLSIANPALRLQLHRFLNGLGLRVVEESSPEHCRQIDLMLTDGAVRPELAATSEALRTRPEVTVLAITSCTGSMSRPVTPQVRVSFVERPFGWHGLEEKILELLLARIRARAEGDVAGPTNIVIVTGLPVARC